MGSFLLVSDSFNKVLDESHFAWPDVHIEDFANYVHTTSATSASTFAHEFACFYEHGYVLIWPLAVIVRKVPIHGVNAYI